MESPHTPLKGFSLVELLIVLGIITIISAIVLLSHTSFNRSILVTNTAYSVAVTIRQAQSFGLSSRAFAGYNNAGYGVSFNEGDMTQYTLFGDIGGSNAPTWCPKGAAGTPEAKPGNCAINKATETVTTYSLGQGFSITDFCGISPTGTTYCAPGNMVAMDVVFMRPNTESIITGYVEAGSGGGGRDGNVSDTVMMELSCAVVWIKAPGASGATRCVTISQTGQVAVPSTCPATTFTTCP